MISFQLDQHGFHALRDGVLTLTHQVGHWLIHFHYLCLASSKSDLDGLVESVCELESARQISIQPGPYHTAVHVEIDEHVSERRHAMSEQLRLVGEGFAESTLSHQHMHWALPRQLT